ncbi:MAG TPA: hypothetical protein VGA01_14770 [Candidatus Binatia bacterium]
MRTKKRTLVTSKVYGFNPWMDQLTTINQIMETTGQKSEAPIIRDLIDEALVARRRKTSVTESAEQPAPTQELTESLHTIQVLLLKSIEQGQTAVRAESLSLELLQETLAEARAGRIGLWETLAVPALKEAGGHAQQIASLFDRQTEEAKNFAYGLAEEIRDELLAGETDSNIAIDDDDRQGRLTYDDPIAGQDKGEQAA